MKDWRGTEIELGDTILYSVKHSTWVEVNEGVIVEQFNRASWNGPKLAFTVVWNKSSSNDSRRIKTVTLRNTETITVINKP